MSTHIPVLIVGSGLNGLTAAALLAHQGIGCMVVKRHADTSIQYKFAGISPRSMEIFRGLGLEAEIRAKRSGDQQGAALCGEEALPIQICDGAMARCQPLQPHAACDLRPARSGTDPAALR